MEVPVLRFLRIAAAVVFAIVCLASCALWVRSHYVADTAVGSIGVLDNLRFISARGKLVITAHPNVPGRRDAWTYYKVKPDFGETASITDTKPPLPIRFGWKRGYNSVAVTIPQWFVVPLFGVLSVLFALPGSYWVQSFRRFSVRDLLIVAALICTLMALIVMGAR
jgi:hypothetical protein